MEEGTVPPPPAWEDVDLKVQGNYNWPNDKLYEYGSDRYFHPEGKDEWYQWLGTPHGFNAESFAAEVAKNAGFDPTFKARRWNVDPATLPPIEPVKKPEAPLVPEKKLEGKRLQGPLTDRQRRALQLQQQRDWEDYLVENGLEARTGFQGRNNRNRSKDGAEHVYVNGKWQALSTDPYAVNERELSKADRTAYSAMTPAQKAEWRFNRAWQAKEAERQVAAVEADRQKAEAVQRVPVQYRAQADDERQKARSAEIMAADAQRAEIQAQRDAERQEAYAQYQEQLKEQQRQRLQARRQWEDYYRPPKIDIAGNLERGIRDLISDERTKRIINIINRTY